MPGLLYSVPLNPQQASVDSCLHWRLLHWEASLAQSLVGSLLLSLGSWCAHGFVCALQESVTPACGSFVIKPHWLSKSNSLVVLSPWMPRLGNLLWALELSQQHKNFFGIIVLQFVGCFLSGSVVGLTYCASQVCCSQSPCPCSRPLLICASAGDTQTFKGRSGLVSCGVPGSLCTQGFVWALWVSLVCVGFDFRCSFPPPTIFVLLLCPWTWGIFFWWGPTFSCGWLFSSYLQFWSSHRRRWEHILLLHHISEGVICIFLFVICVICYFFHLHSNKLINDKLKLPFLPWGFCLFDIVLALRGSLMSLMILGINKILQDSLSKVLTFWMWSLMSYCSLF